MKEEQLISTSLAISLPRPCPTFQSLVLTCYIRILLGKVFLGEGIVRVYESICQFFRQKKVSYFSKYLFLISHWLTVRSLRVILKITEYIMSVLFLFCEILVFNRYKDSYGHGVILLSLEKKKMFSSIFWFTGERIRKVEKRETLVIPSCLSHRNAR